MDMSDKPSSEARPTIDEIKKQLMMVRSRAQEKLQYHREMVDFYVQEVELISGFWTEESATPPREESRPQMPTRGRYSE